MCVPHQQVSKIGLRSESTLAKWLRTKNYEVYDAVDRGTRDTIPRSNRECRIVQYDSCRGLEGWTVILDEFDTFFENKLFEATKKDDIDEMALDFRLLEQLTRSS